MRVTERTAFCTQKTCWVEQPQFSRSFVTQRRQKNVDAQRQRGTGGEPAHHTASKTGETKNGYPRNSRRTYKDNRYFRVPKSRPAGRFAQSPKSVIRKCATPIASSLFAWASARSFADWRGRSRPCCEGACAFCDLSSNTSLRWYSSVGRAWAGGLSHWE